ncbi:MAG: carbamoyl-phosphate synthase domain-containing protein, partial [Sarcina sp.]
MKAKLILQDGTIFEGKAFGYLQETVGEVIFSTGMAGYQEVVTDPS